MTLRWRAFEKITRRLIRAEVRQSELLRKEYKLACKAARRQFRVRAWWFRIILLGGLTPFAYFAGASPDYIIALVFLWTLGTIFYRAAQLHASLYYGPNLLVFDLLPISNDDVLTVQWRQIILLSLWSVLDFGTLYSILVAHSGVGIVDVIASGIAFALVQCMFILAMSVCIVAFVPIKNLVVLAWPFQVSAFILFFAGMNQPHLCHWLCSMACWMPPIGAILQALGIWSNDLIHGFLPGLMAVGVLALARFAFRRMRLEFALAEPNPASDGRSQALQDLGEQYTLTPEAAQAAIQERQFLAAFDWPNADFVERLVSRLLNPRERLIAEFMVAGNPCWTRQFRSFFIIIPFGVVLVWFFMARSISVGPTLPAFAVCIFWGSFMGTWRGFALPQAVGLQSSIFALYPIGFWELTAAVLKINLVRYFLYVVVLFGALAVLTQNPQFGGMAILWYGVKILIVGFMFQPIVAFVPISPGTNDTQKMRLAVPAVLLILALVGSTITFVMAWSFWFVAVAGLVTALLSIIALMVYGRWFNRGRFDLIPLTKTESSMSNSGS